MYIRRDGSVQGPLWPQEIREIVTAKFMDVSAIICLLMSTPYSMQNSSVVNVAEDSAV